MSETFCPPGFGVVSTVQVVVAAAGEAIRASTVATAVSVAGNHRLVTCAPSHSWPPAGAARPRVLRPEGPGGFTVSRRVGCPGRPGGQGPGRCRAGPPSLFRSGRGRRAAGGAGAGASEALIRARDV